MDIIIKNIDSTYVASLLVVMQKVIDLHRVCIDENQNIARKIDDEFREFDEYIARKAANWANELATK